MVQFWRGNAVGRHLCVRRGTLTLSRVALKEATVNQQGTVAAQLELSRRSVHRILKSDLNLYPYKMTTVLPKLTVPNKHQRVAFAEWDQNNEVLFNNVWFSFEAHFHLDRVVNKQNLYFQASENSHDI
jgi:hypothetical protein